MPYNAQKIIIVDNYSDDESPLELCISKNDKVYVNRKHYHTYSNKTSLHLSTHGGKVYLPRGKLLSISSENPIEGIVSSRGYIHSQQNIDLIIDNPDLKLHLFGGLAISVNNKLLSTTDLSKYTNIASLGDATINFYKEYFSRINKPKIEHDKKGTRANFLNARTEILYVFEVCDYADILYLHADGMLNIHNDAMKIIDMVRPDDPDRMHNLYIAKIHDDLLDAITKKDLNAAKKAFNEWESYIKMLDKEDKYKLTRKKLPGKR